MANYLVTVVNKTTGKRSEIRVEARNRAAAFDIADQDPEVVAGAVRDIPDDWTEDQPQSATDDPTVAALQESNRRLRQILILLIVVLVVIPVLLGIILAVAGSA